MILTSGLIVLRHCFGRLRAVRFDSIEDRRRHTNRSAEINPTIKNRQVALARAINLQTLQTLFLLFNTLNNQSGMIEFDECRFAVLMK
jgi:hypothetical protein